MTQAQIDSYFTEETIRIRRHIDLQHFSGGASSAELSIAARDKQAWLYCMLAYWTDARLVEWFQGWCSDTEEGRRLVKSDTKVLEVRHFTTKQGVTLRQLLTDQHYCNTKANTHNSATLYMQCNFDTGKAVLRCWSHRQYERENCSQIPQSPYISLELPEPYALISAIYSTNHTAAENIICWDGEILEESQRAIRQEKLKRLKRNLMLAEC